MNYSVIITFYQNINMLRNCIHALMNTLRNYENTEVILVNDNPNTNLNPYFEGKSFLVPFKLIQNTQNQGHSGACNIGAKSCRGQYIIFLDCDIIVSTGWLEALKETFFKHSNCGAAMSTILDFSTNQVVYAGMELYKSESIKPFQGALCQHSFLMSDHASEIITSGCMMIRKAVFEQVDGFDERFFNSCNDLDLSMKLNASGYRNYVSANSIVYHRGNVSGEIRFTSHIYARSYFFQKWGNEIQERFQALTLLAQLYSQQNIPDGDYLIVNFSSSLFSNDYIACLCQAKQISQIDNYHIRCSQSKIIITDYLQWDICQLNTPILYFTDSFRNVLANYLWFRLRTGKGDVIADWNGNLMRSPQYDGNSENIAET